MSKYSNDTDAALHFLCMAGWANESTGGFPESDVVAWRITNKPEDVAECNTEFNSLLEDSLIDLTPELRQSLVGHNLVLEDNHGTVVVINYGDEASLIHSFRIIERRA